MNVRVWFLSAICCVSAPLLAGDWPQIHGPHRNGVADNERLAEKWPVNGPKVVWQEPVGSGYSGVAVSGGKTLIFHRRGDEDLLDARDPRNGKPLWTARFPSSFQPSITENDGPLCVPTVAEGVVVCFSADGRMSAVELETGKPLWSQELFKLFQAQPGYFGAGCSPLVYDKKIIVNVGGDRQQAGIVALDLRTGKSLWTRTPDQASYSSPILMQVDGQPVIICITRLNVVALTPEDGTLLWKVPFGKRGPTVNAALPVVQGDGLFLTASYGVGAYFLKCKKNDVETVWKTDEFLSSQYTTSVPVGGAYYGMDGRQDVGKASLCCFDPATQTMHWKQEDFTIGHLLAADGKLILLTDDGELMLIRPNLKKFDLLSKARVSSKTTRALPALSNGLLYIRDNDRVQCLNVGSE